MESKLKQLIEEASSVLITSHIGPDGDSVSSSVLLYKILSLNYPGKNIIISMEEEAPHLSFVDGYDQIKFQSLAEAFKEARPQLLILLDANNLSRVTRHPDEVRGVIADTKLAIIDHHEPEGRDESEVYLNLGNPAVSQDIYEIFIERLGCQKPQGYAQIAVLGIYTDTGGFIYKNPNPQKTFAVVSALVADGANLELVANKLSSVSSAAMKVLGILIDNLSSFGDCTYSYIGDEAIVGFNNQAVREATDIFRNDYLRNVDGRKWGFLVYKDLLGDGNIYSVSFRALSDTVDVSKIAVSLGGGGHKPAAGAKISATSIEDALNQVKTAVEKNVNS